MCVRAEGVALHLDGSGACVDESKGEVRSGPARRAGRAHRRISPIRGTSGNFRFRSSNFFVVFAKNAESPSDLERSKSVHKGRFQDFTSSSLPSPMPLLILLPVLAVASLLLR